ELDQARAALDPLPAGTPGVELVRAVAYRRLGGVHLKGASGGDGMAELATALAHATAAAAGGDRDARAELARIHDRLSDARISRSDAPGALDEARAGLAIREQLATQEPGDLENQLGVATSWDKLSRIAIRNNDPRAAGEAADHEAQVIARLVERDPDNARWGRLLMLAYQRRAEAEEAAEHYAAAAASIRSAIAAAQRLLDLDPSNVDRQWDVNSLTSKLASHLTYAHRPDEALAVLRRALPAAQALLAKVPANLEYQRNIGILHEYMGDILSEQHKYQDAVDEYRLRLQIDEDLARRRPDVTIYKTTVGVTQFLVGDTLVNLPAHRDEAIAVMTDALAKLHALRDAGQLNKEALAGMAEREAELAAKQRRSAQ
ncbi:MAG TPA: hypothetical protein VK601_27525, partial [Kofleriaceae bacterium]|nr:hypothetical protein [Kofleriaceae bacterium]